MADLPSSHSESIELLTTDDDGRAIEGPKYPVELGVVKYLPSGEYSDPDDVSLAYPHKFFKYDENRQPIPETLVRFLVPDYLRDGPNPSRRALELVAERMGWDR